MTIKRIRAAAQTLKTVPRSGRKVQPENRDDLRVTHAQPFWIYYRIRGDAIEVITVRHYRQRQPTHW
jgi:plasmid stabilization system protein ParE